MHPRAQGATYTREAQWAARERRRSAAYEAVRAAGAAEAGRDASSLASSPSALMQGSSSRATSPLHLKSRGMLTRLLSSAASQTAGGGDSQEPSAGSPARGAARPAGRAAGRLAVEVPQGEQQQQQPAAALGSVTRVLPAGAAGSPWGASPSRAGAPAAPTAALPLPPSPFSEGQRLQRRSSSREAVGWSPASRARPASAAAALQGCGAGGLRTARSGRGVDQGESLYCCCCLAQVGRGWWTVWVRVPFG